MSIHCGTSYGKIAHKVPTQDLPAPAGGEGTGQGRLPREVALRSREVRR